MVSSVSPQAPPSVVMNPRTWRVLLVEPSSHLMRYWLEQEGHETVEITSLEGARSALLGARTIVCLDLSGGGKISHQVLHWMQTHHPSLPAVVVGKQDTDSAPESFFGVCESVSKPFDRGRLLSALERALRRCEVAEGGASSDKDLAKRTLDGVLSGRSAAILELDERVTRVLLRDVSVCLLGERGTGKAELAKTIHQKSARRSGPYLSVDCSALDPSEHELALFGDARGKTSGVPGALELASGGTLLIEHVGLLSPRAQQLLSLALASRKVRRVGADVDISVNVRIIAAHSGSLHELVDHLRDDLYFRLVVYPVHVPSLRERAVDIPLLASLLLRQLFAEDCPALSAEALQALVRYPWRGNLREMEHVLYQSGLNAQQGLIHVTDLPSAFQPAGEEAHTRRRPLLARGPDLPEDAVMPLKDLERLAIEHALRLTNGNVSLAARQLGIGRATLYRRLSQLGLI